MLTRGQSGKFLINRKKKEEDKETKESTLLVMELYSRIVQGLPARSFFSLPPEVEEKVETVKGVPYIALHYQDNYSF
eukprot:gene9744-6832_t